MKPAENTLTQWGIAEHIAPYLSHAEHNGTIRSIVEHNGAPRSRATHLKLCWSKALPCDQIQSNEAIGAYYNKLEHSRAHKIMAEQYGAIRSITERYGAKWSIMEHRGAGQRISSFVGVKPYHATKYNQMKPSEHTLTQWGIAEHIAAYLSHAEHNGAIRSIVEHNGAPRSRATHLKLCWSKALPCDQIQSNEAISAYYNKLEHNRTHQIMA